MKRRFDKKKYGQRWQVETVNSMIKRRLGSALRARNYKTQCREIVLRVITQSLMIIIRFKVFYRASLTPFPLPSSNAIVPGGPFQLKPFDPFNLILT